MSPAFVSGKDAMGSSATKRLIALTERKMARLRRRRVSLTKKLSTALSQERILGCLWGCVVLDDWLGWPAASAPAPRPY